MMKNLIIVILTIGTACFAFAQSAEESLLFSNQNFDGTARSSAMGGAFSSLGGDISVASTNPAGLAIFRNSTASITPGMYFNKISGDGKSGNKSRFVIPSTGLVFVSKNSETGVKNWNFGFTYNQGANFNTKEHFEDLNSKYSLLDDIAYDANNDANGNFNPYKEEALKNYDKNSDVGLLPGMAYNTYLISPTGANGAYQSPILTGDLMNRFEDISTKGSSGEIALSFAGNYEDKLYFGATLGLQNINYERSNKYDEKVANNDQSILDYFYYDKFKQTQGGGVNLKLGLIYRPINELRLGVAFHTPTFYSLEDEYLYSMYSNFKSEPEKNAGMEFTQEYPRNGETGIFEYEYRTPWKFTFGGSYIFNKIGLLSIDYDLIDYSSAKFYDGGNFDEVNQNIKDSYKLTGNLKVGAEVRLNKQFALRAGYNHFGNMYDDKTKMEQKASQYSAGLGYRFKNTFIDASYQHYTQEFTAGDYSRNMDVNKVKLTFGFKF